MMQSIVRYEDSYFYYGWKIHALGSVRGERLSFFDIWDADSSTQSQIIRDRLADNYGDDGERGLINRLDRDTAGLLYFAKKQEYHDRFKERQQNNNIMKHYIADIVGHPGRDSLSINRSIKHHPSAKDRMLICDKNDPQAIACVSQCSLMFYDKEKNRSTLEISIHKGARHQIRCHLASVGCPIIGEKIYKKKKDHDEHLHLWSLGFSTLV